MFENVNRKFEVFKKEKGVPQDFFPRMSSVKFPLVVRQYRWSDDMSIGLSCNEANGVVDILGLSVGGCEGNGSGYGFVLDGG